MDRAFPILLLALLLASCSPRIVERVVAQHDTTYIVKRDSVTFYDRDSVFIREKGDTVYQYVERWRWRDRVRVDTITRIKVDSLTVERIKEVPVQIPLSGWERLKIRAFWWLLGLVAAMLLWTFRKFIFKI